MRLSKQKNEMPGLSSYDTLRKQPFRMMPETLKKSVFRNSFTVRYHETLKQPMRGAVEETISIQKTILCLLQDDARYTPSPLPTQHFVSLPLTHCYPFKPLSGAGVSNIRVDCISVDIAALLCTQPGSFDLEPRVQSPERRAQSPAARQLNCLPQNIPTSERICHDANSSMTMRPTFIQST